MSHDYMKDLVLAYELSWRTLEDKKFMKRKEWKDIRQKILLRDNNTCQYCGIQYLTRMAINHIDGNPKNHSDNNLEVICSSCHKITHSGLWAKVFNTLDVYEESKFNQNEIIRITDNMRDNGKTDEEIIAFLSLKRKVPWKQDLDYLSTKYGFVTSRKINKFDSEISLTEKEQLDAIENKDKW